jgi:hypothetical protein
MMATRSAARLALSGRPWLQLRALSTAGPPARPRELYEQIVQRFESSSAPRRSALHSFLLAARTEEEGELAVSAYRMFARKDRPPPTKETTALLLKSTLRTRCYDPVLEMLEASKWNGLLPTESGLHALQAQLEREQDWARLARLYHVRVELGLVSSIDAVRSAQRALIGLGRLSAAVRLLSADKPLTAPLVRPFMYATALGACADAGKHELGKRAWAQLLASGLTPTAQCLAEAMRNVLAAEGEGGGADAAVQLFTQTTDGPVPQASALEAVAQRLPDFTAEHLAHFGGKEAVSAIVPSAVKTLSDVPAAAQGDGDATPDPAHEDKRKVERKPAAKEEVLRDGRDEGLI